MIWFVVLIMLAFEGLAVCTLGYMVTDGISAYLAMASAILIVTIGTVIARAMYRTAS